MGAEVGVTRLQQVSDEISTLQAVVDKLPEGRERKKLEERRALLERERNLLLRRESLESKEQAIGRRQIDNPAGRLQALIRTRDAHAQPLQTRLDNLNGRLHEAAVRRDSLSTARQKLAASRPGIERDTRLAGLDEQLLTAGEEIDALQLQREAVGFGMALASELESMAQRLHDEPASPPLNVRRWWERRQELRERVARLAQAEESAAAVNDRRDAEYEVLRLAKEKLAGIDEEIALLAPQTGFFRSTPGFDRLLAAANREKAALAARIPFLEAQHAALEEAASVATQTVDTLRTADEWLALRQQHFARRLAYWLAWPATAVMGVLTLFAASSRWALPRLYGREMLVSARRVNRYLASAVLAAVLAGFFFEDLRVLATTLGIVSAALVIALQDVFASLAGWFAIIVGGKIRVGDRVEIDGVKGDVLEIQLFRTTVNEIDGGLHLDHPTGRIVGIPNSFIFRTRVHNATHWHRWVWLRTDITVTFETPLAEATAVIRRALEETSAEDFIAARREAAGMEQRYGCPDAVYEPKLHWVIADSGVTFTLVTIADYRSKSAMLDRLHSRILADFARDSRLQFAYPTHRALLAREHAVPTSPSMTAQTAAEPPGPTRLSAWPGSAN
jgi:small-conductance mechanosensitive channel